MNEKCLCGEMVEPTVRTLTGLYCANSKCTPFKESRVHMRGLASLDPVKRAEIAAMGGKRAHELGKAHKFTSEQAREAGRKGGLSKRGVLSEKMW